MSHGNDKGRKANWHAPANQDLKSLCAHHASKNGVSLADIIEYAVAMHVYSMDPVEFEKRGLLPLIQRKPEKREPLPRWTNGLSERSARALVSHGFGGRVEVKRLIAKDADALSGVQNLGEKQRAEILGWVK